MKIAQIQFTPWDKVYNFSVGDVDASLGDKVIVKTEMGMEIGEVVGCFDTAGREAGCDCPNKADCAHHNNFESDKELKPIIRLANREDFEKLVSEEKKEEALEYCTKAAGKYALEMKLVGAHFAFDGSRVTFAFIADGRIDFRELVKDLTRKFNRTVRLQQIGIRDEAKITGDYGHCGRPLCCRGFLRDLASITSEMAEVQQCAHRGSERLSGVCGRLMCCLAYEEKGYSELFKNMPPIGAKVNVDGKRGVIVGHHILKQSVNVSFFGENGTEGGTVVEVSLNRKKE